MKILKEVLAEKKWEMLAASKLKMSGSEKENEQEHKQQFFGRTYDISSVKDLTKVSRCNCATTMAKKCTKKCAARAKLLFAN